MAQAMHPVEAMSRSLLACALAVLVSGCSAEAASSDADESAAASSAKAAVSSIAGRDLRFEIVSAKSGATFSAVRKSTRADAEFDVVGTGVRITPRMRRIHAQPKPGLVADLAGVDVPTNLVAGATLRLMVFDVTNASAGADATSVTTAEGLNMFEHLTIDGNAAGDAVSSMTYHTVRLSTGAKETGTLALPGLVDGSRKYAVMVAPARMESGSSLLGTHFYELTVDAPAFLPGMY
jgi:hypothetical protein